MAHLIAFAGLAAVIVALPGPATALVMTNTLRHGGSAGRWTAVGLLGADLLWASATVAGLTALLVTSQVAFDVIRFIGAGYLVFFGIRLLLSRERPGVPDAGDAPSRPPARPRRRALRQGVMCNLSNPKTLLVFTSVVPQMAPSSADAATLALYGVLFATIGFCSSLAYAAVSARARRATTRPRVRELILRASGLVIVGFGVRLATERR
jgi:threonine/homoserine/homoserine lactone efflux protein